MDKHTKLGSDGMVDIEASTAAYAAALTAWKAENELPNDQIESAVNAVLAGSANGRVQTPALLSLAANKISSDFSAYKSLTTRIRAYVDSEVAAGKMFIIKGPAGGCSRTAPVKKEPKVKAAEQAPVETPAPTPEQ